MKPPSIPLDKILALEPVCLRMTVPESYRDRNGHMNMRWYLALFDMFMVNETSGKLAAIFECVSAFADLTVRRTAPFPPDIVSKIAAGVAASAKLDWPAAVCGAMQA